MSYLVIKNRNRSDLPVEMLTYIGASDERGLTGQGFGTKYSAALCLHLGLEFAKASHDEKGPYIARYKSKPSKIRDKTEQQIYLVIERPNEPVETIETTMLVRAATSAWGVHPLGDGYAIVREAVLDAVDELSFSRAEVGKIDFSPPGHTYSFIEMNEEVRFVYENWDYYFKDMSKGMVADLGSVKLFPCSTVDETRIFLTYSDGSSRPKLAYVAWSNGVNRKASTPAYDYVLVETRYTKYASVPKRVLEDVGDVTWRIRTAMETITDGRVLLPILKGLAAHEKTPSFEYDIGVVNLDRDAAGKALTQMYGGALLHDHESDDVASDARFAGRSFKVVPLRIYTIAAQSNKPTLRGAMRGASEGEKIRALNNTETARLDAAIKYLCSISQREDWRCGHVFVAIENNGGKHIAYHSCHHKGQSDAIAIDFALHRDKEHLAETVAHELAHHFDTSGDPAQHGMSFSQALLKLFTRPDN